MPTEERINQLHAVRNAVIDYYGYTLNEILSKGRTKEVAQARQIATWACLNHPMRFPVDSVMAAFNRTRSGYHYIFKKVNDDAQVNAAFKAELETVSQIAINATK